MRLTRKQPMTFLPGDLVRSTTPPGPPCIVLTAEPHGEAPRLAVRLLGDDFKPITDDPVYIIHPKDWQLLYRAETK